MRNLKKLLAVIVSICVLATFTVPAFAADSTLSADTKTCADIGVLVGDGGGVTPEYGATVPTRVQALVMVLRLTGNLADAQAFTGTENFADVSKASWAKSLLAYAKAHPELGFVGDGTNFNPTAEITPQEYYKVLLTALGYAIPADYAYADTLTFAKNTVKLAMGGDVEKFTIDSLAVATDEGLKAKVKHGSKTLAAKLVDAGKLDKAAAVAAGLYVEAPAVVTVASVSADNLKQVVVAFNGAVDEDSAEDVGNYSIDGYTFESASLGDDGKTVTLSLDAEFELSSDYGAFKNQTEYKITVDGVKDASGKTIAKADKIAFTPVDTTIPSVKEVTALGTKALKIVFTEPVKKSSASSTSKIKIDGKSIAGSVKYNFSDNVIISTTMTVGEHKLSIDGVEDFYGLKVNVKDIAFTVAEDTTAPEIVSAKAIDLKKVEVVFNEPVKAVTKAYHTSSSKTATLPITPDDTKVTLTFKDAMSVNNTTVTLENVEDYSGNKATRTVDVTPVLDTERPTVSSVKVEKDGSVHKFTVTFSESVKEDTTAASAEEGSNYVIKDKDAKVVSGKGLNSNGSPSDNSITYTDSKKQAVFSLSALLAAGDYTIEISGIQDTAVVSNTMMPYTYSFTIGDTSSPTISRTWIEQDPVTGTSPTKYDAVIYVQFSEDMAVEGNGNVVDKFKYNYTLNYTSPAAATWVPISTDSTLEMVAPDTLKITLPRSTINYKDAPKLGIKVTLVSDVAGNFLAASNDYVTTTSVGAKDDIKLDTIKATATNTIEVVFKGILTNISANDFKVKVGANERPVDLETYSTADGKTTAIFKLYNEDDELDADVGANTDLVIDADPSTQDAFGAIIESGTFAIEDKIVPEAIDFAGDVEFELAKALTPETYTLTLKFSENITTAVAVQLYSALTVKVDSNDTKDDASITNIVVNGDEVTLTVDTSGIDDGLTGKVDEVNSVWEVSLLDANNTVKAIKDLNGNAAKPFTRSAKYSDVD